MDIFSDIAGWFTSLLDNVGSIAVGFLLLGFAFQWGQTMFNSIAWRSVLAAAYPDKKILQKEISAGYAGGVALNSVLPGQAGTVTYLGLFRASISGSSVATIVSGAAVQAIFWSIVGGLVYLVLFLSRAGRVRRDAGLAGGSSATTRSSRSPSRRHGRADRARGARDQSGGIAQWDQARPGRGDPSHSAPLSRPGGDVPGALLRLPDRVNATFMLAYSIGPTPHNLFIVIAAASIAAVFSVAPGGVGATTAVLLIALAGEASQATITAYSVGQQAACVLANICLGALLMVKVFGWDATRSVMRRKKKNNGESPPPAPTRSRRRSSRAAPGTRTANRRSRSRSVPAAARR